jgi:hypothetical protein
VVKDPRVKTSQRAFEQQGALLQQLYGRWSALNAGVNRTAPAASRQLRALERSRLGAGDAGAGRAPARGRGAGLSSPSRRALVDVQRESPRDVLRHQRRPGRHAGRPGQRGGHRRRGRPRSRRARCRQRPWPGWTPNSAASASGSPRNCRRWEHPALRGAGVEPAGLPRAREACGPRGQGAGSRPGSGRAAPRTPATTAPKHVPGHEEGRRLQQEAAELVEELGDRQCRQEDGQLLERELAGGEACGGIRGMGGLFGKQGKR